MNFSTPGFPVFHYRLEFAPLNRWCHPINHPLSPASPFTFNLSGSLLMSQFFASGGQSIGVSASTSVLPMHIQGWLPLGLTALIFLLSKRLTRAFSISTVQKHQFFGAQPSLMVQLAHPYVNTGEFIALTIRTFVGQVISLLFNTLSRFVIAFLPRSVF